ncbi:MAG TPA: DinB family protein [Bryobacteraceae bacterium]|nr:DinB family protein [Bryobacteraceae bacterium]
MKRLLGLALALVSPAGAETLPQGERDRAMSHLHATRKLFIDSLAGVTKEQWAWKPAPEVWSIAEVAEHITVSEDNLFGLVKKVAATPLDPALKPDKANDEKILKSLVDRTRKAQAPEFLKPGNRWKTPEEMVAHFKEARDKTIGYVQTTQEDLRALASAHPRFGALDAYQWLLLIAGHSERHVLQLNEVKTLPGFPK